MMLEKMRAVSNPLTVIALFAALAEIPGTVALATVGKGLQQVFVWSLYISQQLGMSADVTRRAIQRLLERRLILRRRSHGDSFYTLPSSGRDVTDAPNQPMESTG